MVLGEKMDLESLFTIVIALGSCMLPLYFAAIRWAVRMDRLERKVDLIVKHLDRRKLWPDKAPGPIPLVERRKKK